MHGLGYFARQMSSLTQERSDCSKWKRVLVVCTFAWTQGWHLVQGAHGVAWSSAMGLKTRIQVGDG